MVVDEQDVDAGFHLPVLEGVVEEDDIDIGVLAVVLGQTADAIGAAMVDGDSHLRELLLHLERFVADVAHLRGVVGDDKTAGLALVATTQHGKAQVILQQAYEVFHVGRLAGAANGDVADGDDGRLERAALPQPRVKEEIADVDAQAVEPAQGRQPFVDLDEVAFHLLFPSLLNL